MKSALKQLGFTLLELTVGLLVGGVVVAAVLQLFISSKSAYRMQEGVARLQENGRFAVDFISGDLRMAGFQGCLSLVPVGELGSRYQYSLKNDGFYDFTVAIRGYEAGAGVDNKITDAITNAGSPQPTAGIDVLSIHVAERSDATMTSDMTTNSDDLLVNTNNGLQQGDIIVVANCQGYGVAQITNDPSAGVIKHEANVGISPDNDVASIGQAFSADADILRGSIKTYYIAASENDPDIPALWELESTPVSAVPRELIEGVQDMEVYYGVDTDGDNAANRYMNADIVTAGPDPINWGNVVAVRVSLLLQSNDDYLTSEPQPYTFDGTAVSNPGDRRLRRVFTTTIGIRNSLP